MGHLAGDLLQRQRAEQGAAELMRRLRRASNDLGKGVAVGAAQEAERLRLEPLPSAGLSPLPVASSASASAGIG